MKIVIVGAQCVGKTTLVNMLDDEYKEYIIKEVVRNSVKNNPLLKVNENGDDATQYILYNIYEKIMTNTPAYISDRGLFDVVVYTKVLLDNGRVSQETFDDLYNRFVTFSKCNTDIYYYHIPPMFELKPDGFRSVDKNFQSQIEDTINWLIDKMRMEVEINFITTNSRDNDIRLEELKSLINK